MGGQNHSLHSYYNMHHTSIFNIPAKQSILKIVSSIQMIVVLITLSSSSINIVLLVELAFVS